MLNLEIAQGPIQNLHQVGTGLSETIVVHGPAVSDTDAVKCFGNILAHSLVLENARASRLDEDQSEHCLILVLLKQRKPRAQEAYIGSEGALSKTLYNEAGKLLPKWT
jgi:hypothetical protein